MSGWMTPLQTCFASASCHAANSARRFLLSRRGSRCIRCSQTAKVCISPHVTIASTSKPLDATPLILCARGGASFNARAAVGATASVAGPLPVLLVQPFFRTRRQSGAIPPLSAHRPIGKPARGNSSLEPGSAPRSFQSGKARRWRRQGSNPFFAVVACL
jgi:hypothetical protein